MQPRWICSLLFLALGATLSGCRLETSGGFVFAEGREKAERSETLPLEIASGEELRVDLMWGDISVRAADGEAPSVQAHWRASADDQATAQAVLARYRLELKRGSNLLSVRAVGEPLEIKSGLVRQAMAASVDLVLVVPAGVRLAAHSDAGSLDASGPLAACKLTSSYGDVSAEHVRGDTRLETSSGSAKVRDVEGAEVELESQYGDVSARSVRAQQVRLSTSSGDVAIDDVEGQLTLRSSYGSLDVQGSHGELDARTSSGDIDVSTQGEARRKLVTSYGDVSVRGAGGELEAKTSSGNVTVLDGSGSVSAVSSYGDVDVQGCWSGVEATTNSGSVSVKAVESSTVGTPWRISSGYGDVELSIPAAVSCQLEASTSSGEVECDGFRSDDGKPVRKLSRTLGSGGRALGVTSGSGDIQISLSHSSPKALRRL